MMEMVFWLTRIPLLTMLFLETNVALPQV
jgi:hypothetical protein